MSSYGFRDAQGGYGSIRRPTVRPTITAPRAPNNRAGALGVGPTPLGLSTRTPPTPTLTQDGVNGGLAKGPYIGTKTLMPTPTQEPTPQHLPQQPAAPSAPNLSYDYSADPILNQIQALSTQARTDAQSNALMLRKQLAIDYGDPDVANQYGDAATAQAASANPFSVRQQLRTQYDQGTRDLEEQYNQQNLFYGGARAKGLGDFTNQYQGQLAGAAGQEQQALGGINNNLAAALSAANAADIQAQQDAQARALQDALLNHTDPGADGGVGTPDLTYSDFPPNLQPGGPMIPDAGGAASGASYRSPAVGTTLDPLIYALLGRKMDPRFDF